MPRLGKNLGGYFGETIDVRALLRDVEDAARLHGWRSEIFHQTSDFKWFALHRPPRPTPASPAPFRVYLSAGIHGDEPAGPSAASQLLRENRWPENAEIFLLPCLNPVGFSMNRRENADGIDLNRDYRHFQSPEVRAHLAWLSRQQDFDLVLCLHEDWEAQGFYLYELNPAGRVSLAEKIIDDVAAVCPVDPSAIIEERPAQNGIIRPNLNPAERPLWPEALYLLMHHHTRLSYTLEAPSDFPLPVRVAALVAAVQTALQGF